MLCPVLALCHATLLSALRDRRTELHVTEVYLKIKFLSYLAANKNTVHAVYSRDNKLTLIKENTSQFNPSRDILISKYYI